MSQNTIDSEQIKKCRDIISQLREMGHYSKNNVEKLSQFWLQLEDELDQNAYAERLSKLLNYESQFHENLERFVSDFEIECNRIENEMS